MLRSSSPVIGVTRHCTRQMDAAAEVGGEDYAKVCANGNGSAFFTAVGETALSAPRPAFLHISLQFLEER